MFSGTQVASLFAGLGITHVVSVADSTIGPWHEAIAAHPRLRLVRVCREGETWAVAGGLYFGGATPLVLIQCTGMFESGDDLDLPLEPIMEIRVVQELLRENL